MSFIRFVFTILIAGMAVNFAIVLLANNSSHRQMERQNDRDRERFATLLSDVDGRTRRMDIVVESQRMDAHDRTIETVLLVRQYYSTITDEGGPLPVARVTIPGDQLQVGGVKLDFNDQFSPDDPDVKAFGKKKIVYFTLVCGADEWAADGSAGPDERFNFFPAGGVPQLTRLDPPAPPRPPTADERFWVPGAMVPPTPYELRLWHHLWEIIPTSPSGSGLPSINTFPGLTLTWMKPATIVLRRNTLYDALVNPDDASVTLEEDRRHPNILDVMVEEGKFQKTQDAAQNP